MARQTPSQTAPSPFLAFFNAIASSVSRLLAAQNRSAQVLRLQNLSDDELADIGLSRDTILRHVYRDTYYV
ncbi:hypothetical protein AN191_03990 [Loktanella sp. 5RATIMAR09]|uniref:DUF1127 domain-containing protein n=1 Tax=Loktanella sp. 5RATIMAR09 TaxID=1225655 RepID=UPI00070829C8|nr:DUF1127 domain-containing protein [Loktanella sp. 5RATIMAR09]KQI73065.1 hypothetical protein AN191_03990 [Loktanella sp. 5RATIMAR09]